MSCASLAMSAAKASSQALSLTLAERVMRQFKLDDADFNFPANGTGPGTDMSDWLMVPVSTAAEHNFFASNDGVAAMLEGSPRDTRRTRSKKTACANSAL